MIRRQAVGGPHPWPQTQHVDATPRHEYRASVAADDLPLIGWRDVPVHARELLDTLLRVPFDRTGSRGRAPRFAMAPITHSASGVR